MTTSDERCISVTSDADMISARAEARALAERLGFSRTDATLIATAISEVGRNILVHAGTGEITLNPLYDDGRCGLEIVARDAGPGIADIHAALRDGYASRGGLGLGLPGARRLMDEFDIASRLGEGTTVTMKKWRQRDELERLRQKQRPDE
jgi:serine/threonine-protein kinase RsbT